MSIANILNKPSNGCPSNYNLKCNNIDVCSDVTTDNVNTNTINGAVPSALTPGTNGQLFKTVAGAPTWQYFQLGDFSNSLGPADSVLTTNNTITSAAWTRNLSVDSVNSGTIVASGSLTSTVDTNLNNVDITNTLTINNVAPLPSQVLGANGLGVLGWQSISATVFGKSIYYVNGPQDINSLASSTISFGPGYNGLVGQITRTSATIYTCDTAGIYLIEFALSVTPSSSEVFIEITANGGPFARTNYYPNTSYTAATTILSLLVGAVISVRTTRVGVDATAKNALPYLSVGQLMFTRLA